MVPIPESIYFPPLEQCLRGEELLISWKTVWIAICSSGERGLAHPKLESFLLDPYVISLIARPFNPYSFTAAQSKSAFETKTAAINVTPTTKRGYDIDEIKEDALWLSKQAEIDEISALRIVTLEHQSRAYTRIFCDFSDEEVVSLRQAAGEVNAAFSPAVPQVTLPSGKPAPFESKESRRVRALQLYLQECRCLMKCAGYFLSVAFNGNNDAFVAGILQSTGKFKNSRMNDIKDNTDSFEPRIGAEVAKALEESGMNAHKLLQDSIKSLRVSLERLEHGSGWLKDELGRDALEAEWLANKLVESLHIMEIIFRLVDCPAYIPSSEVVLAWFRFLSSFGFFDKLDTRLPEMKVVVEAIQSLSAVVSISMLKIPQSIKMIKIQSSEVSSEGLLLVLDSTAINELYDIMLEAASSLSLLAGPAILGWSLMLREMRNSSQTRREYREVRQSRRAVERFTEESSFDNDDALSIRIEEGASRRRLSGSSWSSIETLPYDEVLERIRLTSSEDDPIRNLFLCALQGSNVFDLLQSIAMRYGRATGPPLIELISIRARLVILTLVQYSTEVLDYASEVVSTLLAVLTGPQPFWELLKDQIKSPFFDVLGTFLNDDYLVQKIVGVAVSRFPYESLPFLKIITAVASYRTDNNISIATKILEHMPSFTFSLSDHFVDYETIQEEDNANTIQLTQPIKLFRPRENMIYTGVQSRGGESMALTLGTDYFTIMPGSQGRIVMESNPKVATWFYEYSGLRYLGKLLETGLMTADHVDALTGEMVDRESIAEIIGLIATLVLSSTSFDDEIGSAGSCDAANSILKEASEGLGRNRDIIAVIFKLFEEELERYSGNSAHEKSTDILIASIQFIYALTPILPGRVWPLLARGKLLDIDGVGGRLLTILGRTELVTHRYDFLVSCIYLFRALVEDTVNRTVLRKPGSTALLRAETSNNLGIGVSQQIISKILLSFTKALSEVYQTSHTWKFEDEMQHLLLSELISTEFCNILYCTYGVGDTQEPQKKLASCLVTSADHILESFSSTRSGYSHFQPFLRVLFDGFSIPMSCPLSTLQLPLLNPWISHVIAGLRFATILIRLGTLLRRPTSQLENHLFSMSRLIARLYAAYEGYKSPVVQLLEALVIGAASVPGEPASLLGNLGAQTSKNFIQMLLDLGKPLDSDAHAIEIWRLSSMIISSRQQWFSIFLLTGRHPKQSLRDSDQHSSGCSRTLLKTALQKLSNIQLLSGPQAIAILEFVSLAQNIWPWAMRDLRNQSDFINSITEYIVSERFPVNVERQEQVIEGCYRMRMAGYIAEILAMYTYHLRQVGNSKHTEKLLVDLQQSFYLRAAVSPTSYNTSLHTNLKPNFEAIYKPCSLQKFKRTLLYPRQLGRSYFYDIQLADKMLNFDQAWAGRKDDGLLKDVTLANINLSLVDTEIALIHGYKLLIIELTADLSGKPQLQLISAGICKDLITANMRSLLPDNIFGQLNQTRIEFALILLQRLVELGCRQPEVIRLLDVVWDCIRSLGYTFEAVLSSGTSPNDGTMSSGNPFGEITFDDATYYRTLLRLLFLALCAQTASDGPSDVSQGTEISFQASSKGKAKAKAQLILSPTPSVSTITEIIDQVIAVGFRQLVVAIHENCPQSIPDDVALLTALLQTCLRAPGIQSCHQTIMELLERYETARVATTLFSWSDKLAIDSDPVYGELSILFLLELSTIPVTAEQLAIAGVLGHISSASITTHIRRSNVSPFADGIGPQRCYSIWVRGILPLVLNMLTAVGPSIAREVALFLLQFPHLLSQSSTALDASLSSSRSPPESASKTKSISTAGDANYPARITYGMVTELHSIALLTRIISVFRDSMAGIDDIPNVPWDAVGVLESAEQLLSTRLVLRQRILPIGVRELEWARKKPLGSRGEARATKSLECENRLEEKVVEELRGIRDALNGGAE